MGAPAAAPGARSGEAIVKATCAACHSTGVGEGAEDRRQGDWAPRIKRGLMG